MTIFDLRTEPWIPVVGIDGSVQELSLCDVLVKAHELRQIRDPLPTVEFGLYRLLIALTVDIFDLRDEIYDLSDLLKAGRFDEVRIDRYFLENSDRFDLFHKEHPFLQTAGMEGDPAKPLAGMLHPLPSGTNAAVFHHAHEDDFGVCPAAAARLLTTIAPFMTAGGAGLAPSINGAPPWYVLVSSRGPQDCTLFETVCLNCFASQLPLATGDAPPAWRDDRQFTAARRTEASYLESLTWRPRRIQLVADRAGCCALTGKESLILVRTMKFAPGAACDFQWTDPNVPYKEGKDGKLVLRPQEGRQIWRDTGPLALLPEAEFGSGEQKIRFFRPLVVDQFQDLLKDDALQTPELHLTLYGIRTDLKMKIFEWQREELALPTALVLERKFHDVASTAMEQADKIAYYLKQAIKKVYPREGKGNKGAYDSLINYSQRQYWDCLRPAYDKLLHGIAPLSPESDNETIKAQEAKWHEDLKRNGWSILNAAIDELDTDARALQRQVDARNYFGSAINSLFATPEQKEAKKARKRVPGPTTKTTAV